MTRHKLILIITSLLLLPSSRATAEEDPLRVITERLLRSEIIIVIDTSGSMNVKPNPYHNMGADCGGNRTLSVDLCGDGHCSGIEGSAANLCTTDCNCSNSWPAPQACSTTKCEVNPWSAIVPSRMYMVKRVLYNLLPEIRNAVNFGLVGFYQSGYWRYYAANCATTKTVSEYFPKEYLTYIGGWDTTSNFPKTSFTYQGTTYTRLDQSSVGLTVDKDSRYARNDNVAIGNRFKWTTAGNTYSSGGFTWEYRGTYYAFTRCGLNTGSYTTQTAYLGPQFTNTFGTWVHSPMYFAWSNPWYGTSQADQGLSFSNSGRVIENLEHVQTQVAQDLKLRRILINMNNQANGGLRPRGGTPTGPAIATAHTHFLARYNGTGPFSSVGADPQNACRARFVLVLTDGQANSGINPATAAANLYNDSTFDIRVKTFVVGLPGLPSSAVSQLDSIADRGDDGQANSSTSAYVASNESELLEGIRDALFEMVSGNYTNVASGVTTTGDSTTVGDMAITPSTDYPGWRGHLRGLDMTTTPPTEIWDAGQEINSMNWWDRKIFTGYPDTYGNHNPVPLLCSSPSGTVNYDGTCGVGTVGVSQIWAEYATPPAKAQVEATVKWLVGENRTWRLGPIFRSAPAIIGRPPIYNISNHQIFRKMHYTRDRLVYVTSNDGILHAFRAANGVEAFGYVPPTLWPQIYQLWQANGQDVDPTQFQWILASSARVEDIPQSCSPAPQQCFWNTELILGMGPGATTLIGMDITNPSTCTATGCTTHTPPFTITKHSRDTSATWPSHVAYTWSAPTLFYESTGNGPSPRMGMGSGYAGSPGEYYNYFGTFPPTGSALSGHGWSQQSGSGALVDYGMTPDTASAVDFNNNRRIIATYQADLKGRIYRYTSGNSSSGAVILNGGTANPIYYSPAVYHKGSNEVLLAAISNAQDEAAPAPGGITTLYMRSETNGTPEGPSGNDYITCRVHEICTGGGACPDAIPLVCNAPSSSAKPVGQPLIVKNAISSTSSQYEVFYVVYDPPATVCETGDTWIIRIATDGTTQTLISSTQYTNTRGTGITIIGGGIDVGLTSAGIGGNQSSITAVLNNITSGSLTGTAPYIETWKEVK